MPRPTWESSEHWTQGYLRSKSRDYSTQQMRGATSSRGLGVLWLGTQYQGVVS